MEAWLAVGVPTIDAPVLLFIIFHVKVGELTVVDAVYKKFKSGD